MNNSKIVSTKRTHAIFLAIVLVTGTIVSLFPSFMTNASAQSESYYGYNSYEPEYSDNNYKNSYENGNSYGPTEYPSYMPDYKPEYPSYSKDIYKSTKDSSDIINKIKCNTNNMNVNGDITGDVNLGNKGQGYSGGYSSNGGGYDGEGYYADGYYADGYKKDKGFECIINNNNNNTIIVAAGAGNATEPLTCEECFTEFLTPEQIANFSAQINPESENLTELCLFLSNLSSQGILEEISVIDGLLFVNVSLENAQNVVECFKNAGFNFIPIP